MNYPAANRLANEAGRRLRGRRIIAILRAFSPVNLHDCRVLDVGASHLHIAREIAETGASVVAMDIDRDALRQGPTDAPLDVIIASGLALPFSDGSFDVVICNHVYEHVEDPHQLMSEIHRVLSPNGYCYFAGGHKYQLIEPHYRLPLLSWMPLEWSNRTLKMLGHGPYDIRFLDQRAIQKLFPAFSEARNITPQLLQHAKEFDLGSEWASAIARALPKKILDMLSRFSPTLVWLLRR